MRLFFYISILSLLVWGCDDAEVKLSTNFGLSDEEGNRRGGTIIVQKKSRSSKKEKVQSVKSVNKNIAKQGEKDEGGFKPIKGFRYSKPLSAYKVGIVISPNLPKMSEGFANRYVVTPALPKGLSFNTSSGHITGRPKEEFSPSSFTVTASNPKYSATTKLELAVTGMQKLCIPNRRGQNVTIVRGLELSERYQERQSFSKIILPEITINKPQVAAFGHNKFAVICSAGGESPGSVTIIDAIEDKVLRKDIPIGVRPEDIAYGQGKFAIVNKGFNSNGSIIIIDAKSNAIEKTLVKSINKPHRVVYGYGQFAILNENSVIFVSAQTGEVLAKIQEPFLKPVDLSFGNNRFIVLDEGNEENKGFVALIRVENYEIVTISKGINKPRTAAFGDNKFAVINEGENGSLTFIDAIENRVIESLGDGIDGTEEIAFGNNRFALINGPKNNVKIIHVNQIKAPPIQIRTDPIPIEIVFANHMFFITNRISNLTIIDALNDRKIENELTDIPFNEGTTASLKSPAPVFCALATDKKKVTLIDVATNSACGHISFLESNPLVVCSGPGTFAIADDQDEVSLIDVLAQQKRHWGSRREKIKLHGSAQAMVYGAGYFAVAVDVFSSTEDEITFIEGENGIVRHFVVGNRPVAVAYGDGLFGVISQLSKSFVCIDTKGKIKAKVSFEQDYIPTAIAFGQGNFAVINQQIGENEGQVVFIDCRGSQAKVKKVTVGVAPEAIAFGNNRFVVANRLDNKLSVIENLSKVSQKINVGLFPVSVAFGDNRFVVANQGGDDITVVDAASLKVLQKSIPVSFGPKRVVFGANRFVISHLSAETATIYDSILNKIVTNVTLGGSNGKTPPIYGVAFHDNP